MTPALICFIRVLPAFLQSTGDLARESVTIEGNVMTDNAEFKALVRRRMEATGEKYTEAYRALLRAAEREVHPQAAATPDDGPNASRQSFMATPKDGPDANLQPLNATRIGRRPDNDIIVNDLGVSKAHAELRRSPSGRFTIIDLGSHNGTYVNGTQVDQVELTEGDIISIGQATFRFSGGELCPCAGERLVRIVRRQRQ